MTRNTTTTSQRGRARVLAALLALALGAGAAHAQTTDAMLDTLQHRAFGYFWNEVNPVNGLMRDRSQSGSPASIASQGFGLSAICVAIDRGWITREAGRDRVLTALNTFWSLPQGTSISGTIGYQGFFYHFLHMSDGLRQYEWNTELSTIDTALLLAGILHCREYFDGVDAPEIQIRALADSIYRRVDWNFMKNPGNKAIRHGWNPNGGAGTFIPYDWIGYSEAMILYVLALGSPTHALTDSAWTTWTSGYNWQSQFGQTFVTFPPLFGHQYSHCWIDFRNIADAYGRRPDRNLTYFENSRRATLAQRAYAIANPAKGYSDSLWGLTASDGPEGYNARGAPPAQNDNGTITPTAPISSIPFAPNECLAVTWYLWNHYRTGPLWGPYGFRDAFNLFVNPDWYDTDYIGIDQGPIVLMIENYRTGSVWNRFLRNQDVHRGLERAGFLPFGAGDVDDAPLTGVTLAAHPNPFKDSTHIRFRLPSAARVRLTVHDLAGREVARLVDGVRAAGEHDVTLPGALLPAGVYHYRLESGGRSWSNRVVLVR
jgi:hypothetical protein